jgi:hypothetical protein
LTDRKHYYPDVPGLGNVAVSRHAQSRMDEETIAEDVFASVLLTAADVPDGADIVKREGRGITIVILRRPEPFKGAMLVKTVYRTQSQARAR